MAALDTPGAAVATFSPIQEVTRSKQFSSHPWEQHVTIISPHYLVSPPPPHLFLYVLMGIQYKQAAIFYIAPYLSIPRTLYSQYTLHDTFVLF